MLEKGIISAGDIVQFKAGTDSHIRICAIALCTLDAELTSVINGGHAVHGVKQSIAAVYPVVISQIACQTGNVVIIHKVVHIDIAVLTKLILDRMCDLKVVAVVVGGINSLVALVIGNAVKHFGICPAAVVAVDYLAHEPEIGLHASCKAMYALDKVIVKAICGIKANTVDIPCFYPHFDSVQQIFNDLVVSQVQLYQVIAVVPSLVPEAVIISGVAAEIKVAEPAAVS